jgi:mannose-6-phosphate isomerase-like protein (cupin superfamily)
MITPDMLDSIIEHKKARKIVIFKAFNKDVPSWAEVIDYLDVSSNMDTPEETGLGDYVKGNVMTKEHFYYYMFSHGYLGETSQEIEHQMHQALQAPGGMSGVFINFSSNLIDVRMHRDPQDNFYWQCIGSTEWVFNGQSHTVEPGDVVFIPAYADHAVNFSMPRAAISFWWDLDQSPAFKEN